MTTTAATNTHIHPDQELITIADYVVRKSLHSPLALTTARLCLMDALGCALLALQYPACCALLGPIIPETKIPIGAKVPGTSFFLDPILAAFNIGTIIRWLDFNDTWLAAEWGHPSDNLGAILAVSDYMSRKKIAEKKSPLLIRDVLDALIKAYEIQGVLALENSFNQRGFDHVVLVKIASTALATYLLGGTQTQIVDALSQSLVDGVVLRTYRHAPNTGSRKSWAAGDATSRGVRLAWLSLQSEMGYPKVLSTKKWGFNDALLSGEKLKINSSLNSYVVENILFKISFPAEFHAQTAVEAAIYLHPIIKNKIKNIKKIELTTQEPAIRIISKKGPLHNPADRDHCLQYMVAVGLLFGELKADHYEDSFSKNPLIDELRDKMVVTEDPQFTKDYLDPSKRSIANSIQVFFEDNTQTEKITVHYPIGHRRRREEGLPYLYKKFEDNISSHFSDNKSRELIALFHDQDALEMMPVNELMDLFSKD